MLYIVTGGSGSGKSEYAEQLAIESGCSPRIYLATMRVWDEEGKRRVARHREMRQNKDFLTIERGTDIGAEIFTKEEKDCEKNAVFLLECMSNLTANEFYQCETQAEERILEGINCLQKQCRDLIIVTNEVFSDGKTYDPETERYIRLLGAVNCSLGGMADSVTEVVYKIPIRIK